MSRASLLALTLPVLLVANAAADLVPRETVEKALAVDGGTAKLSGTKRVLVCWSEDDHPKGTHGYKRFAVSLSAMLNKVSGIKAEAVEGFPSDAQWKDADLVVFNLTQRETSDHQYGLIDTHLAKGGSIMVIHQGLVQRARTQLWADRLGYAFRWHEERSKRSAWGAFDEKVTLSVDHEIFRGFPAEFQMKDELYWSLQKGTRGKTTVLGETRAPKAPGKGKPWPAFWTTQHPNPDGPEGRVFCAVVGHQNAITDGPFFRMIVLRATAWCLNEPFTPFKPLVLE